MHIHAHVKNHTHSNKHIDFIGYYVVLNLGPLHLNWQGKIFFCFWVLAPSAATGYSCACSLAIRDSNSYIPLHIMANHQLFMVNLVVFYWYGSACQKHNFVLLLLTSYGLSICILKLMTNNSHTYLQHTKWLYISICILYIANCVAVTCCHNPAVPSWVNSSWKSGSLS